MEHRSHSEQKQKLLSAKAVAGCDAITVNASAEYYKFDKSLVLSWNVNNVDPKKFVVNAVFGFSMPGTTDSNQPHTWVQYGVRQNAFWGELELLWTTSLPDNSSKGFVRFTVADNNLNNPQICGLDLPITIHP